MDDDPIVPQPVDRPNDLPLHDTAQGLIDGLDDLTGRYGPRGVAETLQQLYPGAVEPKRPRRRTGVIIGMTVDFAKMTPELAADIESTIQSRFPEVRVAVIPNATSVAFEWDADE